MWGPDMRLIYREFTLRDGLSWNNLVALVRANARAAIDIDKPLKVIVTQAEAKRRSVQNRYYWAAVITPIAEQAWVGGHQFSKESWHELYGRMFGVCEDITLPDGEVVTRRLSTTDMTVSQFSEYCERVQAHAAQEYGVEFS
ncbi:recombination protein NinB [Alcaligenes faecalis]|nr:recombinase [Alcaligenes faecalis]MBH0311272.1 recombination protein NinB [Alcaligenes faecalis]